MSNDKSDRNSSDDDKSRRWEDLIFGTFERIAQAPNKLKDPKETVGFAFDWVKGMRQEIQEKVREEISTRIGKLDFNQIARKLGDHLAQNYRLKINATVQWVPNEKSKKSGLSSESIEDLDVNLEKVSSSDKDESEYHTP